MMTIALILLSTVDLIVVIVGREVYAANYYTAVVKIFTFVSNNLVFRMFHPRIWHLVTLD